jgi:hypothetical protein
MSTRKEWDAQKKNLMLFTNRIYTDKLSSALDALHKAHGEYKAKKDASKKAALATAASDALKICQQHSRDLEDLKKTAIEEALGYLTKCDKTIANLKQS